MNIGFNLPNISSHTDLTSSTSVLQTSQPGNTSPRATNSLTTIQGFNIFDREFKISPDPSNTYALHVIEFTKEYFLMLIKYLNEAVKPIDDRYQLIDLDQLNTLEDMASAIASKLGHFPVIVNLLNEKSSEYVELLKIKKFNSNNLDVAFNAMASCSLLIKLFQNQHDASDQRALLSQVDSNNLNDSVISFKFIDIDFAIQKLEQFKTEIYFPMFCLLLDPSQNLKSKSLFCKNYTDSFFFKSYVSENSDYNDDFTYILREFVQGAVNAELHDLIQLQIVLDCLKLIKKAPKSRQNLNLLFDIFKKYFESIQTNTIGIRVSNLENTPYEQNQSEIFRFLKQFNRLLEEDLKQFNVVPKNQQDDWADNPTMRNFLKNKSKAQRNRPAKGKNKKKGTPQKTFTPTPSSKIENTTTVTARLLEQKPSVTDVLSQNPIVPPVQPLSQLTPTNLENSDDDSLETIERETNEFMEVFRQFLESDRRQKLERKEAKTKKVEVVSEPETQATEIKLEIPKLGTQHQRTLGMLFQEKPPHLTILGKDVENLIEHKLNGRIEGDGNGSRFKVFFPKDSNKQAGMYEVFHGADKDGYLKSKWALKAADAIRVGINMRHISPELIPDHSQEEKK